MLGNVPEFLARKGDGPLDDDEFHAVVSRAIKDALLYTDELSTDRATATDYYQGQPLGGEMAGRSQVVLTEVRDGILGVLPSLLRIIHGPEHTVEFVPRRGDAVEMAAQATDYVRYVFEEDNRGFLVSHSVLKDGLLKKVGIVKWGREEHETVVTTPYTGLSREQLADLLADESVVPTRLKSRPDELYDAELSVTEREARLWVMPVPPDDFFWNREARSLDDAILVGHRTRLTRGELRKLGITDDVLEAYGGTTPVQTVEEESRRASASSGWAKDATTTPENERILYCESYFTVDRDGDGVAELRRVCTIGDTHYPVKDVPATERPFALFCPDPEPHAMLGGSYYERLKDMQKISSQLLRAVFDSAAIAAFPRTSYVEGQVSVADILNTAIGAPIRMRQPGMVQTVEQPFTGDKLIPLFGILREVVERRIGNQEGAGSLDMDALQSTGREAVNAALLAATAQPELIARLYCEQVLKPMFRGLLRLANHPDSKARIVRLRGNYVEVDPRTWDANMDVSVNVALGSMETEKKLMALEKVIADQQAWLEKLGPSNPMVTLPMVRNAKAKALALTGIRDVDNYYLPLPPDWQPPPPPPPQPTPDQLWIQAEKEMAFQKSMKELAIKRDELRLKEREVDIDRDLRVQEMEQAFAIKKYEIDAKVGQAKEDKALDREIDAEVAETGLTLKALELKRNLDLDMKGDNQ